MSHIKTLSDYEKEALRTATVPMDEKTMHLTWSLALAGEIGELANRTKKVFLHGHPYEGEKVKEELGDVLWYLAVYAHDIGSSLEEIANLNTEKLRKRYPDGFSTEASINRTSEETEVNQD